MDKFKLFRLLKKTEEKDSNANNRLNDKHYQDKKNMNRTPNKYEPIRHIKIKNRELKLNNNNSNNELNITSNLKTENSNVYNTHNIDKSRIMPNKTLNDIMTLKINRNDKKMKINIKKRYYNNINNNTEKNELYNKIVNLWKELGVNYVQQNIFKRISDTLNKNQKEEYFKYEFNKLYNIYNLINLIKNDIKNRENIISQLQKNYSINKSYENLNKETLKQIFSILNDIRKYSIDIIYNIFKLRKEVGYDISTGKYIEKNIFSFGKDYILKINSDLNFLTSSTINKHIIFEKSDPLFLKIKFNFKNNYNFQEIKDEKKIFIIKNYENIINDELIVQKSNSNSNSNNMYNFEKNRIIKAQRGLSKIKLRPKNNNKIIIEANLSRNKTEIISSENFNKFRKNVINLNLFNNKQKKYNLNEDMKIFEKIIEKKIINRNCLFPLNKLIKRNKSYNEKNIIENKSINSYSTYNNRNINIINIDKNAGDKISNFIQNIFDESIIESSEKNKSNEINKLKKEYKELSIELYKDKISNLEKIYNDYYYKKIPEKIKKGFNIQKSIIKYIKGIYPKVLIIKNNNNDDKIIGIITLNYIASNINSISIGKKKSSRYNKILGISSISCLDENLFENILLYTIDFCKQFFYFEIIYLELYYFNNNGKFILYDDFEKIIKSKAQFKWVNMENDGINRKIKYKFINKDINNNINNNDIFNLKIINIIGFEEENKFKKNDIRELTFINDFSINYLLLEMISQNNYKIKDEKNKGINYINDLISKVNFKKINNICSDFLLSQIGNSSEIQKFISENKNIFNINDLIEKINKIVYYENTLGISLININKSFQNVIKQKYKGYLYNVLFKCQISEFSFKDIVNNNKNEDMTFYLIKNTDQNYSIIIYELKENQDFESLQKLLISDNKNISEVFKEIFSKVNQKPIKLDKNIFIPLFNSENNITKFRPSCLRDVTIENNENKFRINCINIVEQMNLGCEESLNLQNYGIELDIFDPEDNIIIKNDFIINFVENDLLYELQIPTVASFFIDKRNWIKY